MQQAAGCIIGKDYPKPIVDHDIVRQQNISRMAAAYAKSKSGKSGNFYLPFLITNITIINFQSLSWKIDIHDVLHFQCPCFHAHEIFFFVRFSHLICPSIVFSHCLPQVYSYKLISKKYGETGS